MCSGGWSFSSPSKKAPTVSVGFSDVKPGTHRPSTLMRCTSKAPPGAMFAAMASLASASQAGSWAHDGVSAMLR
eukprot:3812283-Prymnesium_polylepis.1